MFASNRAESMRGNRSTRATIKQTDDGVDLPVTGSAVMVTLPDVPGQSPGDTRRTFFRLCRRNDVTPVPADDGIHSSRNGRFAYVPEHGPDGKRTGRVILRAADDVEPDAAEWVCVGSPNGIREVCRWVGAEHWTFIVRAKLPRGQRPSEHGPAVRGDDVSLAVKRRVREAKREAGERAGEVDRARERELSGPSADDVQNLTRVAEILGIDVAAIPPTDRPALWALLGEALRLQQTGSDPQRLMVVLGQLGVTL